MATKPTSADFTFASDATFSSGEAAGNPTKIAPAGWPSNLQGFVPGLKYVSEFRNYLWNVMGQWTGWLAAGSSAGAADAHIVETDASGNTAVQDLEVLDDLTVADRATVGGALIVGAAITTNGKLVLDTDGSGIQYRVDTVNLGDLDASLTTEADIYIAAAAPTVTRTITIAHTSPAAQFGERIRAVNTRTAALAGWIFQREDTTELGRISAGSNGGWIEFVFDGTKWWATGAGGDGEITPHT